MNPLGPASAMPGAAPPQAGADAAGAADAAQRERPPGMNIREFAEHSGLTAHTLRYYERVGLMGQVGREANGHRVYGPQDAQWVNFLHHLRQTGMSIREMQRYCALREQGDATLLSRHALLEKHTEKVAAQLRSQHEHLARLRDTVMAYQARLARQGTRMGEPGSAMAAPPRAVDPAHRR